MAEVNPISAAVLGLGRAGYNIHVNALRGRADYKIVAVADPNAERCKQVADEFGSKTFGDLGSMLAGCDAELIVVATASKDHVAHSMQALAAGRHVVVEKPFATSLKEADALIAARDRSGKVLTVHQSRRWAADYAFIRQMLHDPRLGEVFFIKNGAYGFAQRNDWQTLTKYGGGSMNNTAVHYLDGCYLLLESEVKSVWGDLQRILSSGDAEDHCKVIMRGKNGRVIDVEITSACTVPQPSWILYGRRGSLVVQGDKAKLKYAKAIPELTVEDAPIVKSRTYGVQGDVPPLEMIEEELVPKASPGPSFYDCLYATLRQGAELKVKPEECRAVLDLIFKARKGTEFRG